MNFPGHCNQGTQRAPGPRIWGAFLRHKKDGFRVKYLDFRNSSEENIPLAPRASLAHKAFGEAFGVETHMKK